MDLIGFLSDHPISVILFLVAVLLALGKAYFAARTERDAAEADNQERVLKRDEDKKKEAILAGKLKEAEINAQWPQ